MVSVGADYGVVIAEAHEVRTEVDGDGVARVADRLAHGQSGPRGSVGGDGARFGMSIFARDVNGDSKADLLVGAPRKNGGGVEDAGQGFLFFGPTFSAQGHQAFLRPEAKPHDVLGFRALAADVLGDGAIDVLFCSLARHQDMAIVAWSGADFDAAPRVWAPPSDAGHHFVQGLDHGRRGRGAENLLVGDPSFSPSGKSESGRVLIRRLSADS